MTVLVVLLILVVACVALWLWAIAPQLPRADFSAFAKYDYAHRGLHDKDNGVPENSLKAFALAAQCGFGMELDLQLTQDGRVVVHHDRTASSRTCGVDRLIAEMTSGGAVGLPAVLGTEEQVPLFSEVLETVVDGRTPTDHRAEGATPASEDAVPAWPWRCWRATRGCTAWSASTPGSSGGSGSTGRRSCGGS